MAAAAAAGLGATVYAKEEIRRNPNEPIPSWLLTPRKKHWGREAQMDPSCCNMCGQSGILVHVVDGVVEKIEPNHWNPNNYTNISTDFFDGYRSLWLQGRRLDLPEEGNAGIMQLYDPDRVKKPLKRTNTDRSPRRPQMGGNLLGSGAGRDRGQDEGLARGKQKLLWMSEDHSFTHVQGDFCTLYGAQCDAFNLCDVARKASFKTVMSGDRRWPIFSSRNTFCFSAGARRAPSSGCICRELNARNREWRQAGCGGSLSLRHGHEAQEVFDSSRHGWRALALAMESCDCPRQPL